MVDHIDAKEALRQAINSITDGPGDPRSVDGAKVNALQSIAWSLIGILGKDLTLEDDVVGMADLVDRATMLAEIRS